MKKFKLTLCLNYFDRSKRLDVEPDYESGLSIFGLIERYFKSLPCIISVNGKVIREADYSIRSGDHVVLIPVFGLDRLINPLSSGHDPWEAIKKTISSFNSGNSILDLGLDNARVAIQALPGVGGIADWTEEAAKRNPWMVTLGAFAAGLWTFGAGGVLVRYIADRYGITPRAEAPNVPTPTTPHVPTMGFGGGGGGGGGGGFETSNSYSWSPQTMQQLGACVPRIYGEVKVQGNIIAGHISTIEAGSHPGDQVLSCLIALGQGPMKAFNQIEINNKLATSYANVTINGRGGYINQSAIPQFNDTYAPDSAPNLKLEYGVWIEAVTNGNAFNGLELVFTFPGGLYAVQSVSTSLRYVDVEVPIYDNNGAVIGHYTTQKYVGTTTFGGDTVANSVTFSLKYKKAGSATWTDYYSTAFPDGVITITDSKTSSFTKTFRIHNLDAGQYHVIVYRISPEQTGQFSSTVYFTAINSIIYDDFAYPRTGLVSIEAIASSQLSGSFNFASVVQGCYVRVWNGSTWAVEYSTNPAWIAYDILTLPVLDDNGTTFKYDGTYVATPNVIRFDGEDPLRVDLTSFKAWADYCDETTFTDSFGVTKTILGPTGAAEKRFTFNGVFDSNRSQWDCLMEVCKMSRSMIVIKGYKYYVVIDRPTTPVQMFTSGNIIMDSFEETFLSLNDRATEFEVEFLNAQNDYKREVVTIISPHAAITKQSSNEQYIGTTSITQAWRTAQYRLNCNNVLCRFIKFDAEIDAITCTIGDLIYFAHELPQWGFSGRIESVNISGPNAIGVTLDRSDLPYVNSVPYRMRIRQDDDTIIYRDSVGTGTATNYFPFSPTIGSGLIHQHDIYSMGEIYFETKPFRVTKITPNTDLTFSIEAVEYNVTVYDSDVGEPALPTPDYSSLEKLPPVTDLTLNEIVLKLQDGTLSENLDVQFVKPLNFSMVAAEIWYKAPSMTGYVFAGRTYSDTYRITNLPMSGGSELYTVVVSTVNSLGQKLDLNLSPSQTIQLIGMADPPSDVTLFYASQVDDNIRMDWKHIEDGDLAGYEIRMGNAWDTGLVIGSGITDNYFYYRAELSGTYQFFIKAIDNTSHYSVSPTSVIVTAYNITPSLNIVYDHNYVTTPASGTMVNFGYKFTEICPTTRNYTGIDINRSNGDIWVCVSAATGNIYKSTNGTGTFTSVGAASAYWTDIAVCPVTQDVYACVSAGDIYRSSKGTGAFAALGAGTKNWSAMGAGPTGNIYAGVWSEDIYVRSVGTGSFNALGTGYHSWGGIDADAFGNMWFSAYGGNTHKQTGGVGPLVDTGVACGASYGIAVDSFNNQFLARYTEGLVYKNTVGTGTFVSMAQSFSPATCYGMASDRYDHIYLTVYGGKIYKFENNNLCGSDESFQFKLSSGSGSYETPDIDLLRSGNKTVRFIDDIDSSEDATDLTFPDRTDLTYPDDTDLHISGDYYKYPIFMATASTGATKWWGVEWTPYYGPVEVNAQYFKFREDFRIASTTAKLSICSFRTIIDVPETAYKLSALSISASGTTISFATYGLTFWATPGISATPINSAIPLVPYIYNKSATGFTIKLIDIVGDGVAGTADINIFGY